MPILEFPPLDTADENGLLAVGGDLSVPSLILAYSSGIFPWPLSPKVITWFAPPRRSILWLKDFHIGRTLQRELKKTRLTFSCDRDFESVITNCARAENRRNERGRKQRGTWIVPAMVRAYIDFHRAGHAHSIEAWDEGSLVGGLYLVSINKMVAGESMFYLAPNASKLALAKLVIELRERGIEWIDCQVTTPLFHSLGAVEISREEFSALLKEALRTPVKVFPLWQ